MDKNIVASVVISLTIGALGGYVYGAEHTVAPPVIHQMSDGGVMNGMMQSSMQSEMEAMTGGLAGKSADQFDRAFLSEMIVHHQGAVAMAELALQNAKHDELKQFAKNIITSQSAEIVQMKTWQSTWYGGAK